MLIVPQVIRMKTAKSRQLTRKEREYQAHRQEILEAAEQVFTQKGYYQATMEEIACEAEFATGTIYNFFKSKEDLYQQVIMKIAQGFMNEFEKEILSEDAPREAIAALIRLRLMHYQEHRGFFRVYFDTSPGSRLDPVGAIPKKCEAIYEDYIEQVIGIFRRGVDRGTFDDLDPLYLTLSIEGVINALVAYWSRTEPHEPIEDRIEKMQDMFLSRIQIKLQKNRRKSWRK